ncbi:hypothetical protein [Streptomyces sp. AP-93]|uniref:hypothetical protein n=1 Tax=Streptomyces sp. AP-93 TaxID=2929048 RepID=UPI001FAE9C87|nr:hypothetical protein [Streptomyces sp. AP-93]MCJ0872618.1 hypothetical protein [Streptomyces sp. AP-93]
MTPTALRLTAVVRAPHGVDAAHRVAEGEDLADVVAAEIVPTTLGTCTRSALVTFVAWMLPEDK